MSQPESNNVGINDAWSLMKILYAIIQMLQTVAGWFSSPSAESFPQDESGELMRRYMARQSWFDRISYDWTNRSFFQKSTFIIGLTLFSGIIGLFLGAPTIIALSVAFIALTLHSLLVSHEQERRTTATVATIGDTVSDFSVAVKDIRQSQTVFSHAANSFCLFVNEQPKPKIEVVCEEDSSDDFLNLLLKQNEEDDELLEFIGFDTNHSK